MMKKLRIFAASPSDMANERAKVETVANALKPLADSLNIVLDVLDWKKVVPNMGRPEEVILDQLEPSSWDVFIGILWHRFGTRPGAKDPKTEKQYSSGTEEEFKTAFRLWVQHKKPRIMMYRCMRAIPPDALNPNQYKKVKKFFEQFEAVKGEHPGLSQSFDTTEAFEKLLLDNLQRLLLEYAEELEGKPIAPEVLASFAVKSPDNLPRRGSFFGREQEMDIVLATLSPEDRTWGILIDGIGGIGKTALALEAAYRSKESNLFDAFVFVTAKQSLLVPSGIREVTPPARTLEEFLNETARILGQTGIAQLSGMEKRRALIDSLREQRALLVYDNLETLAKEEQEALTEFLRQLPSRCKAIITSRQRGGEGAVWLRLEQLKWEAACEIIEEEARKDKLLVEKLERVGRSRWQELHDATGGSPLALMHLLGLMRVRLALTFDGALEMLRGSHDPDLQKFVFQEARRELTTNDETTLCALSFFVPSATFEALMEVAQLSRQALEITIDRLSALSLVDVFAGQERYSLHPLTRNFTRDELLVDTGLASQFRMRFAKYWAAYAQRYGGSSDSYSTFDLLELEWRNLSAATDSLWETAAVRDGEIAEKNAATVLDDMAAALCGSKGPLFFLGRWDELVQLATHAFEAMQALREWSKAGWRAYQVGWIYGLNGRNLPEQALLWADRCEEAWARGGSKYEQAVAKRVRGMVAEQENQIDLAEKLYLEAQATFSELNYNDGVASMLASLGGLEYLRQNYDRAEGYFRQALALDESNNSKEGLAVRSGNLGLIALRKKQWEDARKWYEKELHLALELMRLDVISDAQYGLARVYEEEGRPDLALPLAHEALVLAERLRHPSTDSLKALLQRLAST